MPNGNSFIEEYQGGSLDQLLGLSPELLQDIWDQMSTGTFELSNYPEVGNDLFDYWFSQGGADPESISSIFSTIAGMSDYLGQNPLYQYQGVPSTVMDALGNVLGGLEGYQVDYDEMFGEDWNVGNIPIGLIEGMIPANMFGYDVTDPESIAQALSAVHWGEDAAYNPDTHIRAAEVKALTPEQIAKTTGAYYEPFESAERGELVDKLSKEIGKVKTGGFAGSGARAGGLSGAEQLYRGGYSDILKDIMKLKSGATEDVLDTIYGWQEILSEQ